jgi:hypothetical protein
MHGLLAMFERNYQNARGKRKREKQKARNKVRNK